MPPLAINLLEVAWVFMFVSLGIALLAVAWERFHS